MTSGSQKFRHLNDLLVVGGVVLIFGILFVVIYLTLPKTQKNISTTKKQASAAADRKADEINLNNTISGKVIEVDRANRIVTVETLGERKEKYKVLIPENTVLSRPTPIREGADPNTINYPSIVEKFEDLHVGSVLSVLSKEDPNLTTNLTAIKIGVLV